MYIPLLFLVLLAHGILALNPYEVLGVEKDANEKQIKSAYRQLSKKYHPDKNSDEGAHEKFIEVGEAYEILIDETKRSNFDRFGSAEGPPQQDFDFGDIINQFFGGQGNPRQQQRGKPRGQDTQASLDVSLLDFYRGKDLEFDVGMVNICETCEGSGSKDRKTHKCEQCQGQGFITIRRQFGPGMIQTMQTPCDSCQGKGNKITNKCDECHGERTIRKGRHYSVYLKPGLKRGGDVILEGEGDQNPDWTPGNLIIKLQEDFKKSWGYHRIGNNLYRTEALSLKQALKGGWNRSIPFFDEIDHEIELSRPEGVIVADGEVEVIKGKGMPIDGEHDDEFGDLYIEYKVVMLGKKSEVLHDEL